jgi:hypothetical protein
LRRLRVGALVLVTRLYDESRPRLQSRGEPNNITPTRLPKGSFVVKGAIHSSLAVRLQRERRERTMSRCKLHWTDRDVEWEPITRSAASYVESCGGLSDGSPTRRVRDAPRPVLLRAQRLTDGRH